jgi:hypothetical protein
MAAGIGPQERCAPFVTARAPPIALAKSSPRERKPVTKPGRLRSHAVVGYLAAPTPLRHPPNSRDKSDAWCLRQRRRAGNFGPGVKTSPLASLELSSGRSGSQWMPKAPQAQTPRRSKCALSISSTLRVPAARFGAAPVTPTASVSGVPEAYVAARSRAAAPSCSITLSSPCAYFRYCSAMR